MVFPSTNLASSAKALLGAMFGGLVCFATSIGAQNLAAPAVGRLEPIVVTARKRADPEVDEKVKKKIEAALHSDAFFYDEHVTVTIKDGVVTLRGMVFDEWDLRQARHISERIAGVRRVINDLEIELGGD